jgi:hypothetical protein
VAITFPASGFRNCPFGFTTSDPLSGYVHSTGAVIVAIAIRSSSVTSVTIGGNAMTLLGSHTGDSNQKFYVYRYDSLAGGTYDVVVSVDAETFYAGFQVVSVAGAAAAPFSNAVSAGESSGTTPSVTVTVASGRIAFMACAVRDTTIAFTPDGSQTQIREDVTTNGTDDPIEFTLNANYQASTGSVVMDGTNGSATGWAAVGFAIEEAGGGGGGGGTERETTSRGIARGVARGIAA